ncbi:MAG: STAS domain-containing protein [Vicinamibacterales bacterium]
MTNSNPAPAARGRWELSATASRGERGLSIALAGRLAARDAERVRGILNDAGRDHTRILLDLRDLDYISSAGVLVLQRASDRLGAVGGALVLEHVQPAVRAVLDLAGVDFQAD